MIEKIVFLEIKFEVKIEKYLLIMLICNEEEIND